MAASQQMLMGSAGSRYFSISGSASGTAGSGFSAGATLTVRRDGTWQLTVTGSGTPSPSGSQDYVSPKSATVGDGLWVRATLSGGETLGGAATGTWLQLSADRTWTKLSTVAEDDATPVIELATDSGGANIVSSGSVFMAFQHV